MGTRPASRRAQPRAGRSPEPPASAHERHDRDQPDQELRREHLPERDERAERSGARAHERFPRSAPRANDSQIQSSITTCTIVGRRQGRPQLCRRRSATRGSSHLQPEAEDVVRSEQERRSEALDLQRPARLALMLCQTPPGERTTNGRKTGATTPSAKREAGQRLASARALPDVRDAERDEHRRIDLGRTPRPSSACPIRTRPETSAASAAATIAAGQRSKRREDRPSRAAAAPAPRRAATTRPQLLRRDCAQRTTAIARERERAARPASTSRSARKPRRDADVSVRERQREHRQRARRILDVEVAVRDLPVRDQVAVVLVDRRVDDLLVLVEAGGATPSTTPRRARSPRTRRRSPNGDQMLGSACSRPLLSSTANTTKGKNHGM